MEFIVNSVDKDRASEPLFLEIAKIMMSGEEVASSGIIIFMG